MTTAFSKNVSQLFSGNKRARLVPTLAIAVFVTALVVVPLTVRAVDAVDQNPPILAGDSALVLFDTAATEPTPLDSASVSGAALISYRDPGATAVSFALFAHGDAEALLVSHDPEGPQFDLLVSDTGGGLPLDTSMLADGRYDLFVTASAGAVEERTAVSFTVVNS